jgi:dipeptidyl aminopeptidase/acylaminoacyl peptidase
MAPYGSWPTPITSELVLASAVSLDEAQVDGTDVYWAEHRPDEGGRTQLVRRAADGTTTELLPDGMNARTAVHEYGGGAWWVRDGVVWFTAWNDQRLYRLGADGRPVPLTPEPDVPRGDRYADGDLSPDGRWIACIREHHPAGGRGAVDVRNEIVRLAAHEPSAPEVLVSGADFAIAPRWDADGSRLCWIEWDHPSMPWDDSRLLVRDLATGDDTLIAGGPGESVSEPQWQADGSLTFISDRTGWWNLYRWSADRGVEPLIDIVADIGVPEWVRGLSRYAVLDDGRIVFARWRDGFDGLAVWFADRTIRDLDLPYRAVETVVAAGGTSVVVVGSSPTSESSVARVEFDRVVETLRAPRDLGLDPAYLSVPEAISVPSEDGRLAHALFYPPANPDGDPPAGGRPPLLVMIHGGPTGAAWPGLRLNVQFWTSRGFAVADVNYGGSTGYGRAYRKLLAGRWGVVDVADCIAVARRLGDEGRVDPQRLCIRGGSAGGFTTLAVLARADTPFAAGADHFGVADLAALAADTHKFESRYLDGLLGPYPEAADVYRQRSPITHVDEFRRPLIVLQGLEDEVVPPNQAEMIVAALREKGVPVAYLPFEGEQHGFRRAENIRRALEAELSFYAQVLGFDLPPDEGIEPVAVENLH